SARIKCTALALNACITSLVDNTNRLFTWHVAHQAAVKSTNTGRPLARYSSIFAGSNGCQAFLAFAGSAATVNALALGSATHTAAPASARLNKAPARS